MKTVYDHRMIKSTSLDNAPQYCKSYSTWSACMFAYLLPGHSCTLNCLNQK